MRLPKRKKGGTRERREKERKGRRGGRKEGRKEETKKSRGKYGISWVSVKKIANICVFVRAFFAERSWC